MISKITKKRPKAKVVSIMGSTWHIEWRTKEEDVKLIKCDGYCDKTIKTIVLAWLDWDGMNYNSMATYMSTVLRHEMVHAMLFESGLGSETTNNWARNEEMVDWIALQLPRLAITILPIADEVCKDLESDLTLIK